MSGHLLRRAVLFLALAAGALSGSAAAAQAASVVAFGNDPDAIVDRDGTTHLVWNQSRPATGASDVLHYCRMPRGATTCANEIEREPGVGANPDTADTEGPAVMVTPFGEVILLTNRDFKNLIYISDDGGQTFSTTPKELGSVGSSYTGNTGPAIFDGADRRIITIAAPTGGIRLQAAPVARDDVPQPNTTDSARLSAEDSYDPSVVQRGPGSFVAAWGTLRDVVTVRTFTCPGCALGDANVEAKWTAPVSIPGATNPRLVSGPNGTFVIYLSTVQGATYRQYFARRIDGTAVGPPTPVSEPGVGSFFRDAIQDEGGVLHMLYVGNGTTMSYKTSTDAAAWGPTQILQPGPDFTLGHARVAARTVDDGFVGFAFWESQDGSQQNPPILAAPLPAPSATLPRPPDVAPPGPPADPGGGPQVPEPPAACRVLSFAAVDVVADACMTKVGDAYVATGGVKINGLRVALGSGKLRFEPKNRRITSSGATVTLKAGDTVLLKDDLDWTLPKGSVASLGSIDVGGAGGKLLGFPLAGSAELKLRGGGAEIPIHIALPALLGGITGDVTIRADNLAGVHLRELHVKVGDAYLGILEIKDLTFDYDADAQTWAGGGILVLPPQPPGPSLESHIGFSKGELDYLRNELTLPGSGIPLDPFAVTYLKKIRFSLETKPLALAGGVTITAGPTIAGVAAIGIDGDLKFTFPDAPKPAILRVDGRVSLVSVPLASAFFELRTNGYVGFGGELGYESSGFEISARVDGWLFKSAFNVEAGARVCLGDLGCAGGDVVLSSEGFAGCAYTAIADFGVGYRWGEGLDLMFTGCDVGPYRATAQAAQAGAAPGFRFGAGLPSGFVAVQGAGAPPHVSLVGPEGQRVDAPAAGPLKTDTAIAFHVAETNTTYFALKRPAAGAWRVEAAADSVPITGVKVADGIEDPKVTAAVRRGAGRTRVLSYNVAARPGQKVIFAEEGPGAARPLGTAKGTRGTVRFTPTDGPGGTRRIIAMVSSYGAPRTTLTVARYVAPPPPRPGTPKRLRARRSGTGLTVTWAASANAKRYQVRTALSDGRRLLSLQKGTRLRVPAVTRATRATITVRALRADGVRSRPATVKVAGRKAAQRKR